MAHDIDIIELRPSWEAKAQEREILRVVENHNDDHRMHVDAAPYFTVAESWGAFLADIAYVIVSENDFSTRREDGDVFDAICEGFIVAIQDYRH